MQIADTACRGGVARVSFPLHFALLAVVAGLYVTVLAHADLAIGAALGGHLIFATEGALYGLTLALALRAPAVPARRALFVVLSAASAVAASHAGVWSRDAVLAHLARGGRTLGSRAEDTLVVTLTAAFGALAYSWLVRAMWLPQLARSAPVLITVGCGAAMIVMAATVASVERHLEWFVVLWWLTFSAGLWWAWRRCTRPDGAARGHRA